VHNYWHNGRHVTAGLTPAVGISQELEQMMKKEKERAEFDNLLPRLQQLGEYLDQYLRFEQADALQNKQQWQSIVEADLPEQGVGIEKVLTELGESIIPNGSQIPRPGCTSFITTGATNMGVLATLASAVAAPQRLGLNAFSHLEETSLRWLADMFELADMKGIYSSGGSTANLVALGAARQWAFEKLGIDPAAEGITKPCRLYASKASHHTIHRAAAVLGMGRDSVITIESDSMSRMLPEKLQQQLQQDKDKDDVAVAIVANAGTTNSGAIDDLEALGNIAKQHGIWFHIDGAYGLPGILDPEVRPLYKGLSFADSVIVDPHKWLGAPVGIGATFVKDRSILFRAFTQGASDYLEGSFSSEDAEHSMDQPGVPYYDLGVELSAPSRGAVVWALLREIGKQGLTERIIRHNKMARHVADRVMQHPNLELLQQPTLSIVCFRYVDSNIADLNKLNNKIHRQLVHNNRNIPSTVTINGKLAIRPCFVGARTTWQHADDLVDEVISIGNELCTLTNLTELQKNKVRSTT
jgi:glutamate/tyrosine decarboxylase-like PLP-dependent enzyme